MALKPTASDVYTFLESYGIDSECISSTWIENRLDRTVLPFLRKYTRQDFDGIQTITRSYNGNGTKVLILDRKPVNTIVQMQLASVEQYTGDFTKFELEPETGIIRLTGFTNASVFPRGSRNVKVTYTHGYADYPDDIFEAAVMLLAELVTGHLANLTGGGNLTVQSFSRDFGPRGRYSHARDDWKRQAYALLNGYKSGVL